MYRQIIVHQPTTRASRIWTRPWGWGWFDRCGCWLRSKWCRLLDCGWCVRCAKCFLVKRHFWSFPYLSGSVWQRPRTGFTWLKLLIAHGFQQWANCHLQLVDLLRIFFDLGDNLRRLVMITASQSANMLPPLRFKMSITSSDNWSMFCSSPRTSNCTSLICRSVCSFLWSSSLNHLGWQLVFSHVHARFGWSDRVSVSHAFGLARKTSQTEIG